VGTDHGFFGGKKRFGEIVVSEPGEDLSPDLIDSVSDDGQVVLGVSREMLNVGVNLRKDFADSFRLFDERLDGLR